MPRPCNAAPHQGCLRTADTDFPVLHKHFPHQQAAISLPELRRAVEKVFSQEHRKAFNLLWRDLWLPRSETLLNVSYFGCQLVSLELQTDKLNLEIRVFGFHHPHLDEFQEPREPFLNVTMGMPELVN